MPRRWTPSIVPNGDDQNVYLVVDDFGRNGRSTARPTSRSTDLETVIADLLSGQYKNPVRVVAFNTAENGRSTFRPTWPMSRDIAATSRCAISRSGCRTSSTAIRAGITTCSSRCPLRLV